MEISLNKYRAWIVCVALCLIGWQVRIDAKVPTTLSVGYFFSGENTFEEVVGPQLEFSGLVELLQVKDVHLESGLVFWNKRKIFNTQSYVLDSLIIPFQLTLHKPLFWGIDGSIGGGVGPHFLIENLDHTESYIAVHKFMVFGLQKENIVKGFTLKYTISIGQSKFKLVNNLTMGTISYRIGLVKEL